MFCNRTVVCYGIGSNFYSYISRLDSVISIKYFCDSDVSKQGTCPLYDGRKCISITELKKLDNPLVIIMPDTEQLVSQIFDTLKSIGIECIKVRDILNQVDYLPNNSWIDNLANARIHKFIDLNLHGTTTCNFHCDYCYVWRRHEFENTNYLSEHSVKEIRNGLSLDKTGGRCFINMCARGETLLSKDIVELTYELLEEGHYVSIVTNGTVTKNIDRILQFPEEFQSRFFFKFSFHYLELKKHNLFDVFWKNVDKIKQSSCSYTLEITPYDGLVQHISDVKEMFNDKANGAMPHISYARDSRKNDYDILSDYSIDEYAKIWGQFDSKMFELKSRHYGEKITDYCHAGEWSYLVNIPTGDIKACYRQDVIGNIYDRDFRAFPNKPVGNDCHMAYCFNNHAFMAWGDIPTIKEYTYLDMRNRKDKDCLEWVKEPMKSFMADKLYNTNYSYAEKNWKGYREGIDKTNTLPKFYLFNSPDYSNAGDIAIAFAEKAFIEQYFPEYELVEVSCTQYQNEKYKLLESISQSDIVAITGGGNIGSLWMRFEDYYLDIVDSFTNNKLIVFPQTVYFEENNIGKREQERFVQITRNHPNIAFFARDKKTYEFLEKLDLQLTQLCLCPDMAFYLSFDKDFIAAKKEKRVISDTDILLCLRDDKEAQPNFVREIGELKKNSNNITYITMLPVFSTRYTDRLMVLKDVINLISTKHLVITDRLHCMIFCALLGTKCIAIDNISNKLSGAYNWFGDCTNIKIINNHDDLFDIYNELEKNENPIKNGNGILDLKGKFYELAEYIRRLIR